MVATDHPSSFLSEEKAELCGRTVPNRDTDGADLPSRLVHTGNEEERDEAVEWRAKKRRILVQPAAPLGPLISAGRHLGSAALSSNTFLLAHPTMEGDCRRDQGPDPAQFMGGNSRGDPLQMCNVPKLGKGSIQLI